MMKSQNLKLFYLNQSNKKISMYVQQFPPFGLEIGQYNKRGQLLLYALWETKDGILLLNSFDEYYFRLDYRYTFIDRLKNLKRSFNNRLSHALIRVAYKIKDEK